MRTARRRILALGLLIALSIAGAAAATLSGSAPARLPFRATTAAFNNGGANIAAGACVSQAATPVAGAAPGMACAVSPTADPGASFVWECFAAVNSATLRLCNVTTSAAAPGATTYNLEVVP